MCLSYNLFLLSTSFEFSLLFMTLIFLYTCLHNLPLLLVSTALIIGLLEGNRGIVVDSGFAYPGIHFPLSPNKLDFLCTSLVCNLK